MNCHRIYSSYLFSLSYNYLVQGLTTITFKIFEPLICPVLK